jgi:cobalt-zinc-cadmium efflux system membrane fusion protein
MTSLRILLVLLSFAACKPAAPSAEVERAPDGEVWLSKAQVTASQVHLSAAKSAPVPETARLAGHITFDDMRVTHVFPPVTGRVGKIYANPGDKVQRGAPLAEIDSPDVGIAMSDLLKAKADSEAAQHELERQKELYEAHAAPKKDLEVASDAAARAMAELDRTRQKMRLLHVEGTGSVNQTFTLRAPLTGEVVSRMVSPGMEVQGQYSGSNVTELFTIGDIDEVWVIAEVHEMDVGRVHIGQTVSASVVAYPDETFLGKVQWMSEVLDPLTHTARVRVELPNHDRKLRPEMYATLTVTVDERPSVALPRSAIVRLGDVNVVYVARGERPDGRLRFERRRVTLPVEVPAEGMVPVLTGIDPGDIVVEGGAILLSEG